MLPSRLTAALCVTAVAASLGACSGEHAAPAPEVVAPALAAPPLPSAEAGFVDVPADNIAPGMTARMFYDFQAADSRPETRPLLVFFNGGPGFPTTLGLLPYGTGRYTLDANVAAPDTTPVATLNPARFTRFANLLYIDARLTGFGYGVLSDGVRPVAGCKASVDADAEDFVRVILAFLDAHEALRASRVVLVGESYGGTRATHMLHMLLHPGTHPAMSDDLRARIAAHYNVIFPDLAKGDVPIARATTQFAGQVLIEPLVGGQLQYTQQEAILNEVPSRSLWANPKRDASDLTKPAGYADLLDARALAALSDPTAAARLLGVPLDSVPRLAVGGRGIAFRTGPSMGTEDPGAEARFERALGALPPGDNYFGIEMGCVDFETEHATPNYFAENLRDVPTFITNAQNDGIIVSDAIPRMFAHAGFEVETDMAPRPAVARPGWFRILLRASTESSPQRPEARVEVRFPTYAASGHMVAVSEPGPLADDVRTWLGLELE